MSKNVEKYTANYKENLTLYWRQYFPDWSIPVGYHVHHIKPVCTFAEKDDPRIHHPSNLIALHVDDHATIHRLRGDKLTSCLLWAMKGRVVSNETRAKMSETHKTRKRKPLSDEHKRKLSAKLKGVSTGPKSSATKSKMKESAKHRPPVTEETKQKIGAMSRGRKVSAETRKKMSAAKKGKKLTAEHKRKISATLSKIVREKIECPHCGRMSNKKHINFCSKRLNI